MARRYIQTIKNSFLAFEPADVSPLAGNINKGRGRSYSDSKADAVNFFGHGESKAEATDDEPRIVEEFGYEENAKVESDLEEYPKTDSFVSTLCGSEFGDSMAGIPGRGFHGDFYADNDSVVRSADVMGCPDFGVASSHGPCLLSPVMECAQAPSNVSSPQLGPLTSSPQLGPLTALPCLTLACVPFYASPAGLPGDFYAELPAAAAWPTMQSQSSQDPQAAGAVYKRHLEAQGQAAAAEKPQPPKQFSKPRAEAHAEAHPNPKPAERWRGMQCISKVSECDEQTTVMIRNIPNNYTREQLLEVVNGSGFHGKYDFVYLPMDFTKHSNLGYAYVNMRTPNDAQEIQARLDGYHWGHPYTGNKVCEMTYGNAMQGLDRNINRYRNSPVMHESVPDKFKPVLFNEYGDTLPFPPPTKKLKLPKQFESDGQ